MLKSSVKYYSQFKYLYFCLIAITVLFFPFYVYAGIVNAAVALGLGVTISISLSFLFLKLGAINAAKLALILGSNAIVWSTSASLGHSTDSEIYCIPILALGVLIFETKQIKNLGLTVAFTFLTYVMIRSGVGAAEVTSEVREVSEMVGKANFTVSFVVIGLFMWLFARTGEIQKIDFIEKSLSERKLKALLESMNEGLMVQDSEGKIVKHNPALLRILCLTEEEFLGTSPRDSRWRTVREDGSDFPREEQPGMIALKEKRPIRNVTMGLLLPSGEKRWLRVSANPYELLGTNELRVAVSFTDITEIMVARMELEVAQETAKIGNWSFNLKTFEQYWSKEHYRIFEIEPVQEPDQLDVLYRDRIHPEDILELDRLVNRAKSLGEGFEYQHRVLFPDGRIKYVVEIGRVVFDAEGRPDKVTGTCQDVTERVLLERELFEVTENSPGLIYQIQLNKDGQINFPFVVKKNLKFLDLEESDYEKDSSIIAKLVHPEDVGSLSESFKKSALNLTHFAWTGRMITPHGRTVWVSAQSTPKKLEDKSIAWNGFMMDITKQKELEVALQAEQSKALHSSKLASLGEMSAGIAHEINNPLAIISATVPMLLKLREQPQAFENKLQVLTRSAERIARIVKGLRKFARASDHAPKEPHMVSEMIAESLTLTEMKAKRGGVKIISDLEAELVILCDEVEIEQVLVNLINNAIDAVKDLPEKWVKVVSFKHMDQVLVQIIDSGHGVSQEVHNKLFQPFFTTKPVGEGTGLGLSISKGILDQHGASIRVNSAMINTCFEISFPDAAAKSLPRSA